MILSSNFKTVYPSLSPIMAFASLGQKKDDYNQNDLPRQWAFRSPKNFKIPVRFLAATMFCTSS